MYTTIAAYREATVKKRIIIVLISFVLYLLSAYLLFPIFGPTSFALSVVPLLFTAWLFGIKAGILGWVIVVIGNSVLQMLLNLPLLESFLKGLPGIFAVLPFALIAGYVSNLSLKYRSKIEELAEKNDKLEQEILMREDLELLFSEVNHRIKNNLAMITGILELESMKSTNPETTEILSNIKNRIYSVAAVHEQLYKQNNNRGKIPFKIFIQKLLDHIQSGSESREKIKISTDVESFSIDTKFGIHLALIINELVTNALKYAFPDQQEGEIQVQLYGNKNLLELTVRDNGVGLPEDFDPHNTDISKSIGMHMVTNLVRQWDGTLEFENNGGANFSLTFDTDKFEVSKCN